MDKKLLDALGNLSSALEEIAEALKSKSNNGKNSPTTDALQSGNLSTDFKEISLGIKALRKDTQEILKNQRTIMSYSKQKSVDRKSDVFEKSGDKKSENSLKKGIGVIMLIAVAVLAIGMAFKLVGDVKFGTVFARLSVQFRADRLKEQHRVLAFRRPDGCNEAVRNDVLRDNSADPTLCKDLRNRRAVFELAKGCLWSGGDALNPAWQRRRRSWIRWPG
jgi:hypothetical protein